MIEQFHQIEEELRALEVKISGTAQVHRKEAKTLGQAKADFEIAKAKALLEIYNAEGESGERLTEKVRDAKALVACQNEYTLYRCAEAEADSSREALRAFQSELSSVQTRATLIKTELTLTK